MPERKPLELTVYPKGVDPHGTPVYLDGGEFGWRESDVDRWARAKHLTGPELAAEVWREDKEYWRNKWNHLASGGTTHRQFTDRIQILQRFTVYPHYDQEDQ